MSYGHHQSGDHDLQALSVREGLHRRGHCGPGGGGNWGYLGATEAAIHKFKEHLIGKDPFNTEDFYQNFYRSVYFRGSVIMSAISAIDIALWDIKGKALGVPVYQLLGGRTRDKVRVYASVMHNTPVLDDLVQEYVARRRWALPPPRSL